MIDETQAKGDPFWITSVCPTPTGSLGRWIVDTQGNHVKRETMSRKAQSEPTRGELRGKIAELMAKRYPVTPEAASKVFDTLGDASHFTEVVCAMSSYGVTATQLIEVAGVLSPPPSREFNMDGYESYDSQHRLGKFKPQKEQSHG